MALRKVAMLTAGGFAPCLSASVGGLIERYTELAPEVEIIGYRHGYQGLLKGDHLPVTPGVRARARLLHRYGGSPLGNSRVKLTNVKDLVKRGLVAEGADPLKVAADQLAADGIDVLHTIGGDDTNMTGADLAAYLHEHGYELTVVGLPKTIDNDIVPVKQSLGAWTAAEEGAKFARNVVAEHNSNPRMLIIHEIMGRNCGWLTAATAAAYDRWLGTERWLPEFGLSRDAWNMHAIYVPEAEFDLEAESDRLKSVMDTVGNVTIFLSEGAGVDSIVAEMQARGADIPRDPFGHVKLNSINPGAWFGEQFAARLGAEKVLVQKSGYFARSAAPDETDLLLIKQMTDYAVGCALRGISGVVGNDEEQNDQLRAIEFSRIAGGKKFDISQQWFRELLERSGQPAPAAAPVH
ncbi:MAG TPA: pyrophosphate--fructose-6-phosphate 1-phosphotransferase [Nakamurella sp.]|nr:pyrophosphate--fructose-6-phosphate 1-phosphotransferase [Nakamurella sp.]